MLPTIQFFIFSLFMAVCTASCNLDDQRFFIAKNTTTPYPIITNPYDDPSTEYLADVNSNLNNKVQVCALKYLDPLKLTYELRTFPSKEALEPNWTITHQGRCGACSTTQDLWVYLTTDLTRTVRRCGIVNFYSKNALRKCIKGLGFTDPCTQVWMWNTLNTKKHCNLKCIYALLVNQPFIVDGHLNSCLECDEDISGPIFKYESGRTRRNSGIHSEIDRPEDQIYEMEHCYY